ncbi:methyltransferase [Chitinophaga sp. Mgbs1]|uniref:Methyltransferase n=1 Tax=Chitinophaga solisilvae TaxID=1233460 RepID=A0A9Q5D5Y6_9BACT|nr:methyltransferase [Chitinophaga solisilvae]
MKVCTDACIQGAYTARYLNGSDITAPAILDIGAGTGLLSLMLAQQIPAVITAVELDTAAAGQAAANFSSSPWADRLLLTEQDVRKMDGPAAYDFIITNPPFYESALKSGHAQKDQAMHATSLGYRELLQAIDRLLLPQGEFSVLLPAVQFKEFEQLAAGAGFHPARVLQVRQSVNHGYFRTVGIFNRTAGALQTGELAIYNEHNVYTSAFADLLQPYYLYL